MINGLSFKLSEDGNTLQAIYTPTEVRQTLDIPCLKAALDEQGFAELFLFEAALSALINQYAKATETFSLDIGERRDGSATVTLDADKLSASLTLTPPFGGKAIGRQQVLDALTAAGVVSGIMTDEIDATISLGRVGTMQVAQGKAPVDGKNSEFQSLIPEAKGRRPRVDQQGVADYRDLGLFNTVKAGTPLMRRLPATTGEAGENVCGETIPARPGQDIPFAPGLKGVAFDPNDSNLLLAAIAGQPVLVANGVMVEPTLSLQNVDLSTGNLSFEGTVNIAADVKAGMKIKTSGDVIIGGMVEAAEIEAGGDITVKGGIIGHGDVRNHDGTLNPNAARLHCNGSVSARFIENAMVEAGSNIIVEEVVKQSELTAISQVIVGREGAKKGHIIGGLTRATILVQAAVIGSPAGVATKIEVGVNPLIHGKLDALAQHLQQLTKEKEELERVIAFARDNPQRIKPELLEKARRTHEKLQLDSTVCHQDKETLQTQMNLADNAKIVTGQKIYGGSQIRIGNKLRQIVDEHGGGTFRLEEEEIVFGNA